MTTLDKAKKDIIALIAAAAPGLEADPADIGRPPQPQMGDFAFACFAAAKKLRSSPVQIAKDIAAKAAANGFVASVEAAGPYVNFRLEKKAFSAALIDEILADPDGYGLTKGAKKEHVLLEYGSPNTHKEIHVGHLRNFSLGLSVERLMRAAGYEVTPVNYIGDVGAHVAKWLWFFEKTYPEAFASGKRDGLPSFGHIYTAATKLFESDEAKYKPEISAVLQALEKHDPKWEKVWKETRDACLVDIDRIFKELGIHFERTYLESEVEGPGKLLANELLEKGIAKKGEGGALIVDFESQGLGVFLVLKSDGTALYSTKELALARLKFSEYPEAARSVHVVDGRQSLYFQQFFATLRLMGFKEEMVHLGYEFVTLKDGAMSSRKGNIVTYEDFRDEMVGRVAGETRKRHEDWDEGRVKETAWMIAEGAMKFGMLKQDNDRPIVFDMDEALASTGFTGPYIQYAHSRLSSILTRAGGVPQGTPGAAATDDPSEFAVLGLLAGYPAAVVQAAEAYRPSLLAQYLFDLAQASNDFYRDVPVLSSSEPDKSRRLLITRAIRAALRNGLELLGIQTPEEM